MCLIRAALYFMHVIAYKQHASSIKLTASTSIVLFLGDDVVQ